MNAKTTSKYEELVDLNLYLYFHSKLTFLSTMLLIRVLFPELGAPMMAT